MKLPRVSTLAALSTAAGLVYLYAAAVRWRDLHLLACRRIAELERILAHDRRVSDMMLDELTAELRKLRARLDVKVPLTQEQRESLGREAKATYWQDTAPDGYIYEDWCRCAERLFSRGAVHAADVIEAAGLLVEATRHLHPDEMPPALVIPIGRIVVAMDRRGNIPPDRDSSRSDEPATNAERAEVAAPQRPIGEMVVAGVEETDGGQARESTIEGERPWSAWEMLNG